MSIYFYEGYDKDGAIIRGEFDAANEREVVTHLNKHGLTPVSINQIKIGEKEGILAISIFERITPVDIVFLVRNLSAAIRAGLGIIESLDILIEDTKKKILQKVLRTAKSQVKNGQPLSRGFEMNGKYFPPMFLGMLKAAEASGQLDVTLDNLGKYLTKEYNLTRKVRSALTYPVILLIGSVAVIGLLLIFVLPRLTKAFLQSGVELPLVTKILIATSNFLSTYIFVDVGIVAFFIWFFVFFRKTERGRKFFFKILLRVPIASDLVKKVALIRFARTLGGLIGSGIPATEALELSANSVGNYYYREAILKSAKEIQSGIPFSQTFLKYPHLFPHLFVSLILMGEKTGTLTSILATVSDFYEEEVDGKLKDLSSLIEPILLLVMGLVIGAVALSILLPIYQLVGKFT